eukprot:SAG11_NODE_27084_length_337_cov_0.693277_1_plen_62_part_01
MSWWFPRPGPPLAEPVFFISWHEPIVIGYVVVRSVTKRLPLQTWAAGAITVGWGPPEVHPGR